MDLIIKLIILFVLVIMEIGLYFVLMSRLLPRILRVHCSLKESTDRGLKK